MEPFPEEAFELRTVVLQECDDGMFRQVMLSPAVYKKLTQITSVPCADPDPEAGPLKPGMEFRHIALRDDWEMDGDKFLGLQSAYDNINNGE